MKYSQLALRAVKSKYGKRLLKMAKGLSAEQKAKVRQLIRNRISKRVG